MDPTIAIVGDSYVCRLQHYLIQGDLANMNLYPDRCLFEGQGGASVHGYKPVLPLLEKVLPIPSIKIIYLNIGSNDLCDSQYIPDDGRLPWDIYCLAKYALASSSAHTIIIGQIPPRLKEPHPAYNDWVLNTNHQLYNLCSNSDLAIRYNYIKGLQKLNPDIYVDKVHFTPAGNYKLFRGVRGAIMRARQP